VGRWLVLLSGTEGDKEDEARKGREDGEQKNKQMGGVLVVTHRLGTVISLSGACWL